MAEASFSGPEKSAGLDAVVLTASLALNVLALVVPLSILLIFDRVVPFQATETLTMLALIMVASVALTSILQHTRSALLSWAATQSARRNNKVFLSRVLRADPTEFSAQRASVYFESHRALTTLREYNSGANQGLRADVPFVAVFILVIALVGGALVLVPIGVLVAVSAFAFFMKRSQRSVINTRRDLEARRYDFLSQTMNQIQTIKAHTLERPMARRFERLQSETSATTQSMIWYSGFAQSYGAIVTQLSVAALGLLGAHLVLTERIGIADLAVCMMLNGRVVQPIMKLMTLRLQNEAIDIAKTKLAEVGHLKQITAENHVANVTGKIGITDLRIRGSNGTVFDVMGPEGGIPTGAMALVDTGDQLAVSALFDTLMGQTNPVAGGLLIDGLLPSERVAQRGTDGLIRLEKSPVLLSGTILENIAGFKDREYEDRALRFANQLGLEDRVHRLPEGYGTLMSGPGVFQEDPINQQLIAMVRALALQPKVLLMQEPTAALNVAERELFSNCLAEMSSRPTLVIASPDPRIRRLASVTLSVISESDNEVDWHRDVMEDQIGRLPNGAVA